MEKTMDLLENLGINANEVWCCPDCGAWEVHVAAEARSLDHMHGGVKLNALIPVWTCDACGFAYTDGRGEQIEEEVLKDFLRRLLLPREIREIRENLGLSREQFAQLTGFGVASIKRWEGGSLVQNTSTDRYLRLIAHKKIAEELLGLERKIRAART